LSWRRRWCNTRLGRRRRRKTKRRRTRRMKRKEGE
jgi:hypothetical protein